MNQKIPAVFKQAYQGNLFIIKTCSVNLIQGLFIEVTVFNWFGRLCARIGFVAFFEKRSGNTANGMTCWDRSSGKGSHRKCQHLQDLSTFSCSRRGAGVAQAATQNHVKLPKASGENLEQIGDHVPMST